MDQIGNIIDNLPIQDYSQNARRQEKVIGQKAAIRQIDPTDRRDMQRLRTIDRDPKVLRWMAGEPLRDEDLMYDAKGLNEYKIFVISGSQSLKDSNEIGELQGIITVRPDKNERVEELRRLNLISQNSIQPILEVSYAQYPNSANRQVASGLRQVCARISRINAEIAEKSEFSPNILITAYSDSENIDSIRVLENSGFERKGTVNYDGEENSVYVLNWQQLNKLLHEQGEMEFKETI
ncbi:GNAT family N-acetyltransferase [Candidatus Roizmanbacteria bacterium]|nr:GNAT family N-acetyltransferase [Candidatus Roizmanbacteria bacterium]